MSSSSGGTNTLPGRALTEEITIPFALQVSRNLVYKTANVEIFGRNSSVDTTEETLWEHGGNPVLPTVAGNISISSTSAADATTNSGVRTVTVIGLDSDYNIIQEEVTLSGTNTVSSSLEYLRVNLAQAETAGNSNKNMGDIVGSVSGNPIFQISAGDGISHDGFYTVPSGSTAFLDTFEVSVGQNKAVDASLYIKQFGKPQYKVSHSEAYQSTVYVHYNYAVVAPAKSDIWMTGVDGNPGNVVSGRLNLIVIQDDEVYYHHPIDTRSF